MIKKETLEYLSSYKKDECYELCAARDMPTWTELAMIICMTLTVLKRTVRDK